jgi:hypothetical protein
MPRERRRIDCSYSRFREEVSSSGSNETQVTGDEIVSVALQGNSPGETSNSATTPFSLRTANS